MERILLVEDDAQITASLSAFLQSEGFSVETATGETQARQLVEQTAPGLLLVDVQLAEGSGFGVCAYARSRGLPVIFLTASGDESSVVLGLDMGADDYIAKPFHPQELVARVRSQLRRYTQLGDVNAQSQGGEIVNGRLCYRPEERVLLVDGEPVKLTATELKIVDLLMRNLGRVVPAEEIYRRVWNEEAYATENTVMVHIRRIREKIELNPKEPEYLKVVWGIGYKIEKR